MLQFYKRKNKISFKVFDEYHLRTNYPKFDFLCDKKECLKENSSEKSNSTYIEKIRSLSISPPPKHSYGSEDSNNHDNFVAPIPSSSDVFALSRSKLVSLAKTCTLGEFRDEMFKVFQFSFSFFYLLIFIQLTGIPPERQRIWRIEVRKEQSYYWMRDDEKEDESKVFFNIFLFIFVCRCHLFLINQ
jgi:hypothetical protein